MATTIAWRGTFLDTVSPEAQRQPRSSSAPPAQGSRSVGQDLFFGERLYVDALCARAERLCRQPLGKECPPPSAAQPAPEAGRGKEHAFDTSSTTATWSSRASSDGDDSDDEVDEQAFLQDVRTMTEALLQGRDPRQAVKSAQQSSVVAPKAASRQEALPETGKEVTTMMLCDLPCRVLQDQLAETMDAEGFADCYDWLFVPKSRARGSNPGYAFVNFVNAAEAERCVQVFSGYRFSGTASTKVCSVRPARLQGVEANTAQFGAGRRRRRGGSSR